MNMPSPYQEAFYRELSKICDLTVIYEGHLSPDRVQLGWSASLEGYDYRFENQMAFRDQILLRERAFHLLSGFPSRVANVARTKMASGECLIGAQTEMPTVEDFRIRWRLGSKLFARLLQSRRRFAVLGIGKPARQYFRALGIPNEVIFPFAYFPGGFSGTGGRRDGYLLYVGQLVERKGIDVLLQAMAIVGRERVPPLLVAGDGPAYGKLISLSKQLRIDDRVQFHGAIGHHDIARLLAGASALVLPSRFDGWGVVVNEAILFGVPVICSDACGASELVIQSGCGAVFPSGDVTQLAEAISRLCTSNNLWQDWSTRALEYAPKITPSAGADYLLRIAQYAVDERSRESRPNAPWLA